jgi:O-antigen ligase
MLVVVGKTGSRGALVSVLLIAALMFVRASAIGKMKLLVGGAVLLLLAILVLPATLKTRYKTFFRAEEPAATPLSPPEDDTPADPNMITSALTSTATRQNMLKRSLVITLRHPLLGVGPGMFMIAENDMARAEGKRKGTWVGTHNGFTEVSSECGIPALLFYTAIVVFSLKESYSLYRRSRDIPQLNELSSHALALNYSLIVFVLTSMFVHSAYTALLPVLAGLTVSLARVAQPLVPVPARRPRMPVFVRQRSARGATPGFSPARSL